MVNTFLIGVQKAGTTSLYDWIAQHPDVEGHIGLKDIPVFVNPKFEYDENWLNKQYSGTAKINIHGSVQYFFYPEMFINNVNQYIKAGAKFILVLRNPIERALSGYSYAIKSNMLPSIDQNIENRFNLEKEKEILISESANFYEKGMLTPIHHGFYSNALEYILNSIPKSQLSIHIYEEFFKDELKSIYSIYQFLNIDNTFTPTLNKINVSGTMHLKKINKLWTNYFSQKFIKPFFPYHIRQSLRNYITEKNTKPIRLELNNTEWRYLKEIYQSDIEKTEKLLNRRIEIWHQRTVI